MYLTSFMAHALKSRVLPVYCPFVYCPTLLSPSSSLFLKRKECTKLLSWPMPSNREYYPINCCLLLLPSHFPSLLKLEECTKLLLWPTPLSREYQLNAVRLFYCPALWSPDYSLFLNWKNVLNFFHGPCL